MDQSPAPGPGRRMLGTLGPRMTIFVVVDAVLLLAFLVVLALFLSGSIGGSSSARDQTSSAAPTGTASGSTPRPSGTSPGKAATKFTLPSGNISCEITADAATCTIASSTATPPVDASCTGVIGLVLTVTAKGATMPCVHGTVPGKAAAGSAVLNYGQSKTVGDFTCTSSSTGVSCRHDPSGKGFQLAKAGAKLF